jgi:hypothetical protein
MGDRPEAERQELFDILRRVRLGAGDVADTQPHAAPAER